MTWTGVLQLLTDHPPSPDPPIGSGGMPRAMRTRRAASSALDASSAAVVVGERVVASAAKEAHSFVAVANTTTKTHAHDSALDRRNSGRVR